MLAADLGIEFRDILVTELIEAVCQEDDRRLEEFQGFPFGEIRNHNLLTDASQSVEYEIVRLMKRTTVIADDSIEEYTRCVRHFLMVAMNMLRSYLVKRWFTVVRSASIVLKWLAWHSSNPAADRLYSLTMISSCGRPSDPFS